MHNIFTHKIAKSALAGVTLSVGLLLTVCGGGGGSGITPGDPVKHQ
jgi:hypothetical protein